MKKPPSHVTFTCMVLTDGSQTTYGVLRPCKVRRRDGRIVSLDTSMADLVASYTYESGYPVDRLALAQHHETPECPAFDFPGA